MRLDMLLAEPDDPVRYRVDRLWPVGGRVVLNAAWKAGKTTTVGNLVRSLVDGDPFLGAYDVAVTGRPVVVLDDELDMRTIRRWYRDQGIERTDLVYVVPLRGRAASLALLDPAAVDRRAARFREVDAGTVLLDCLSPALAAAGLDENRPGEVRRFLEGFDTLLDRSDTGEGAVIHHIGHAGERARGASALRDWPDSEWSLVREKPDDPAEEPDPSAPRYFRAYGRDVDEPEQRLNFDPHTRRLSIGGASRRLEKRDRYVPNVVAVVTAEPGASRNRIVETLIAEGVPDHQARKARERGVELGRVRIEAGPNKSQRHFTVPGAASTATGAAAPGGGGAAAPMGAAPPHAPPTCADCGAVLDAALADAGMTVHPGCRRSHDQRGTAALPRLRPAPLALDGAAVGSRNPATPSNPRRRIADLQVALKRAGLPVPPPSRSEQRAQRRKDG